MDLDLTDIRGYNLKIYQKKKGYRFSIDSFLLAYFVSRQSCKNLFEIGAGSGVVSFLIDRMSNIKRYFELIEIQGDLFFILKKNLELNRPFNGEFDLRNEDARFVLPSKLPDIVYSNPPFTDYRKGKVSFIVEKSIARHTYRLSLGEIIKWYKDTCGKNTVLCFIDKFENFENYRVMFDKNSIFIKRVINIKPFADKNPNLFIIFAGRKKVVYSEESLTIYAKKGVYTDKVKEILGLI